MLHFHTLTIGKIDGFFLRKPLLFKNQLVLFNWTCLWSSDKKYNLLSFVFSRADT